MGGAQRGTAGRVVSAGEAATAIRAAISLFILILIALCLAGFYWTSGHQPAPKATASHVVLGIAIVSGLGGLIAVWRRSAARP